MGKEQKRKAKLLKIAVLGHKTIPSRQGGIEIVVEELTVRMANSDIKLQSTIAAGITSAAKSLTVKN